MESRKLGAVLGVPFGPGVELGRKGVRDVVALMGLGGGQDFVCNRGTAL